MSNALTAGTVLTDRYRVKKQMGQGGFAITYLAEDLKLGRDVVIREFFPYTMAKRSEDGCVLEPEGELQAFYRKEKGSFLKEARIQASLFEISGVVKVLGYFEEKNTVYEVMEFVDGVTLRSFLETNGEIYSFEKAFSLLEPVMKAAAAIHERGYLHRDISPENIMIQTDGRIKLLDFGASRGYAADPREAKTMTVLYRDGFAPPEQYDPHGKQGPWSDVYALAAVLYYLLTGYMPDSARERQIQDNLYLPSEFGCDISSDTEQKLLKKGLALDVKERYQSVSELMEGLVQKEAAPAEENKRKWDFLPSAVLIAAAAAAAAVTAVWFAGSLRLAEPSENAAVYDRGSEQAAELTAFLQEHALSTQETEEGTVYTLREQDAAAAGLTGNLNFLGADAEALLEAYEARGVQLELLEEEEELTVTEHYGVFTASFLKTRRYYDAEEDCRIRISFDLNTGELYQIQIVPQESGGELSGLCVLAQITTEFLAEELELPEGAVPGSGEFAKDIPESLKALSESPGSLSGFTVGRNIQCLGYYDTQEQKTTVRFVNSEDGI